MENQQTPAPAADNSKLFAILSYILILWLVGLLVAPEKDNPFVKHHVNNGIILTIVGVIASAICGILGLIPVLGAIIGTLVGLAFLAIMIIGIVNAAQDKEFNIPVLSNFKLVK